MAYKRKWRQIEKRRKRCNAFISEYTRLKFGNVYNEAVSFYNALVQLYPDKVDVKKTKEFRSWKEALSQNTENPESNIIVQTLYTSVAYGENDTESQNNDTESQNNDTESQNNDTESQNNDTESQNNDTESQNNDTESENNDTESENNDTESENNHTESPYRDNMLLEIPLESYLPPDCQDKNTQTPVAEPDFEVFSDERLQEIVAELRADPELMNIFDPQEQEEEEEDEEDEGVELKTLEEELEVDIEPFDYRLEVELSDWENQM